MHIVVHPLIDRRRLLTDRLERRMRLEHAQRSGEAVVGDPVHPYIAVVVRHMLDQPVDAVVGIGGLVGRRRVREVDPGGKLEHALRLEAAAQILKDENVPVLH